MTLLIVLQFEDCAMVFNDTLVTHRDGGPDQLMSKLRHFQNPDVLMASTGNHAVAEAWALLVSNSIGADVEDLNAIAPGALREIDRQLTEAHGPLGVSTIYHLGYEKGGDDLAFYEYSSRDNYAGARSVGEYIRVKPKPHGRENYDEWDTLEGVIAAAERIKAHQRSLAPEEGRVLIGGDLFCAQITPKGVEIRSVHRFADYEATVKEILTRRLNRWPRKSVTVFTSDTGTPATS